MSIVRPLALVLAASCAPQDGANLGQLEQPLLDCSATYTLCDAAHPYDCYAEVPCADLVSGGLPAGDQYLSGVSTWGGTIYLEARSTAGDYGEYPLAGVSGAIDMPTGWYCNEAPGEFEVGYYCRDVPSLRYYFTRCDEVAHECRITGLYSDVPVDSVYLTAGGIGFSNPDHFGVDVTLIGTPLTGAGINLGSGESLISEMRGVANTIRLTTDTGRHGYITLNAPLPPDYFDCQLGARSICVEYVPLPSDTCANSHCGQTFKLAREHTVCTLGSGITNCGYPNPCWTEWTNDNGQNDGTGCSCAHDCGYKGTCCADAATYCDSTDGEIDPGDAATALMDGQQFIAQTPLADIASLNGRGRQAQLVVPAGSPAGSLSFAGLTMVSVHEMVGHTEDAHCKIETATPSGALTPYWTVVAETVKRNDLGNKGELDAVCQAKGITWPSTLTPRPAVSGEVHSIAWNKHDYWNAWLTMEDADHFPYLTGYSAADLKDGGEPASCLIHLDWQDSNNPPVVWEYGWYLEAVSTRDSRTHCTARVLDLTGTGIERETFCPPPGDPDTYFCRGAECQEMGDCVDSGRFRAHARGGGMNDSAVQTANVKMYSAFDHACFLTQVYFEDVDDPAENTHCGIEKRNDYWWLLATSTQDLDAHCNAMCLKFPVAFTRPSPTFVTTPSLGEKLTLFQNGAYDKPAIFVEPYDVANTGDAVDVNINYATFVRRAAMQGVDIWTVNISDGGQEILKSSREVAQAIDTAFKYSSFNVTNPGKEIALAGTSMGGVIGRVALASWEANRYTCTPGTGECISPSLGNGTTTPPVGSFVSVGGPQLGAVIPVTVQAMVQDVNNQWNIGKPGLMLNSPAATNVLYARIDNRCGGGSGLITETCGAKTTLRDGTNPWPNYPQLDNVGECETFLNASCVTFDNGVCVQSAWSHDDFFGPTATPGAPNVNSRNVDGFPHTVNTLGVSNGSFHAPPYVTGSALGRLWMHDYGGGVGGCSICPRMSTVTPLIVSPRPAYKPNLEAVPGDHMEQTLVDLAGFIPIPKHVKVVDIDQYFDFTFVPTESALACNGATSQSGCDTTTRFRRVLSRESLPDPADRVNGSHSSLHPQLGAQAVAYLYDTFMDNDGYCSQANPLAWSGAQVGVGTYVGCGGGNDCDDTNPSVGSSASRPCTTTCGTVGTQTCTNGVWTTACTPPAEVCCDDIDNNCAGGIDEGCYTTYHHTGRGCIACSDDEGYCCGNCNLTCCSP